MARDCPKNGRNGGEGNGNDNQTTAKARVSSLTKDQTTNSSGTVSGTLFLNRRAIFVLFDTGATHAVVSVSFTKHISISPTLLIYTLSISTPMESLTTYIRTIAHIEKIFEVLGCADEFMARLASYKLKGDALNWCKAFKQAKGGETHVATLSWKDFYDIFFLQYFPRSEQQKYEREYCYTILTIEMENSGELMNTLLRWDSGTSEFTDVAQVANAARNIEILRERSSQNNKRNLNVTVFDRQLWIAMRGVMIKKVMTVAVMTGRVATVIRSHGRTKVSSTTVLLGLQVTGACFTCGSTGHMARDCPKNGRNGGRGNVNDNQPAAKGRVFSSTKGQAANSSGTVSGTLFLNGRAVFVLFDTGATHSVVSVSFVKHISISLTLLNYTLSISTPMKSLVIIDHEYHNCPLRFDDKIRSANLFPLDMNYFDIKFWAWVG
ncbi:putative reverse transcriptase domain-containing protein [Tanacetum coccineum]